MSRQFNFLAIGNDQHLVAREILAALGDTLILPSKGRRDEMSARQVSRAEDLVFPKQSDLAYLLKSESEPQVQFLEIQDSLYRVDFHASPVVEFSPSIPCENSTLKVGRIALFYVEDPGLSESVRVLFNKLKKEASPVPHYPGLWIFPRATREAEMLQHWVGKPKPNPLYCP